MEGDLTVHLLIRQTPKLVNDQAGWEAAHVGLGEGREDAVSQDTQTCGSWSWQCWVRDGPPIPTPTPLPALLILSQLSTLQPVLLFSFTCVYVVVRHELASGSFGRGAGGLAGNGFICCQPRSSSVPGRLWPDAVLRSEYQAHGSFAAFGLKWEPSKDFLASA